MINARKICSNIKLVILIGQLFQNREQSAVYWVVFFQNMIYQTAAAKISQSLLYINFHHSSDDGQNFLFGTNIEMESCLARILANFASPLRALDFIFRENAFESKCSKLGNLIN